MNTKTMSHLNLIIDDKSVDAEYINSVYSYADPNTGMLSPGDARRSYTNTA